jgi:two-component system sensor histidine kinase/response regulator
MSKKIMIVDDDPVIRILVSDYLETMGYSVETYEGGPAALERAESEPPDLMLVDMQMPEMNGGQVLQRLRENPNLASVPVVICSAANDIAEYTENNFKVRADEYLSKPFEVATLLGLVKSFLNS